jgi:hypothetical protein
MRPKVSDITRNKIDRLPVSFVFTYVDILPDLKTKEAVIKALNRLIDSGRLAKLSKGRYYKPAMSP